MRQYFSKYFDIYALNSLWMVGDRVVSIISAFVWSVILAHVLGITKFGEYQVVVSVVGLLIPIAACGLNGYLNKMYLTDQISTSTVTAIALVLKVLSGVVCLVLANLWLFFSSVIEYDTSVFIYTLILVFHCAQVFESLNQAYSKSKIVANVRFFIVTFFLFLKLSFWLSGELNLFLALIIQSAEFFCYFVCLACFTQVYHARSRIQSIEFYSIPSYAKTMLFGGGWLILSGVAETMNLKVDILMLAELSSVEDVSVYSVATRFSESGYFFAAAIAASYFPKIMEAKRKSVNSVYDVYRQLCKILLCACFCVFVFTAIFAYPLINNLYGPDFSDSYGVLLLHLCASFFVYFRALISKWIIAEDVLRYSLYTHVLGALCNVVVNYFLIPLYGYYGAAIATVISYSVSSYFSLLFFPASREFLSRLKINFLQVKK